MSKATILFYDLPSDEVVQALESVHDWALSDMRGALALPINCTLCVYDTETGRVDRISALDTGEQECRCDEQKPVHNVSNDQFVVIDWDKIFPVEKGLVQDFVELWKKDHS